MLPCASLGFDEVPDEFHEELAKFTGCAVASPKTVAALNHLFQQRIPILQELTDSEKQKLGRTLDLEAFYEGDETIREGDVEAYMFYILDDVEVQSLIPCRNLLLIPWKRRPWRMVPCLLNIQWSFST